MSRHILSKRRDPYEYLERMLSRTTLTTQNVSHQDIVRIGNELLSEAYTEKKEGQTYRVSSAVEQAEIRAAREMRAAMKRQKAEFEFEKTNSLEAQRKYYQKLSEKVNEQRDKAEEERRRELRRDFDREKSEALFQQLMACEKLREEAVRKAYEEATANLRDEFEREKQEAVNVALEEAREQHRQLLEATVLRAQEACRREAEEALAAVGRAHQAELGAAAQRYRALRGEFDRELEHRVRVEKDFMNLQSDYRHFMDYTDEGKFDSDYMMVIRKHGMNLANKRLSRVPHNPANLGKE